MGLGSINPDSAKQRKFEFECNHIKTELMSLFQKQKVLIHREESGGTLCRDNPSSLEKELCTRSPGE